MKIESVRIENFRCFKDETIFLDSYACFVGPNGAGKSTIINALNVFFRQYKDSKTDLSKLSIEDFHHKNTEEDIKITVTFSEMSDKAKEDLADYVRQDKLIITAIAKYNSETETAEVKQYGNRLGFSDFRTFFEKEKIGAKVSELQEVFAELQSIYDDLPEAKTKAKMIEALHEYEEANPEKAVLIPSEDQFYGVSKGVNKLSPHIQWVFVPASKDVSEESEESKNSALGQLLSRTVRSKIDFSEKVTELRNNAKEAYRTLLDSEQRVLDEISTSLQTRLTAWAHPNISAKVLWKQDSEKSVRVEEPLAGIEFGERGFDGALPRFGHGLQRSYMLALLQELAHIDDENSPTLIMGIEEPELYQHPPQARYLAETLVDLSEKGTQVLLCTHNPLFIPGDNFDKIRIVRESGNPSCTTVKSISYSNLTKELEALGETLIRETGMVAKLYPSLNPITNEMFFCKVLVLVEGLEDVAHITSYLMLTGKIVDFRKHGCHIVPVGGKNYLILPLLMSKLLSIPNFVIFDGDTNKENPSEVIKHKKDNKNILSIKSLSESEWPNNHIIKDDLTCWKHNITDDLKEEMGEDWQKALNKASASYDNAAGKKNTLIIAKAHEYAWAENKKSDMLLALVDRIISFAKNS